MKRLLVVLLFILAACSLAYPQNGRRPATGSARNMQGVTIRGNVIHFSPAWEILKGSDGATYARKKKVKAVVLAVSCRCAQEGPRGTCFLQ